MGQRSDSDIKWKEQDCEKMRLSEDGFCNNCKEFHSDCFCEAFWVRRSAQFLKTISQLTERLREADENLTEIDGILMDREAREQIDSFTGQHIAYYMMKYGLPRNTELE